MELIDNIPDLIKEYERMLSLTNKYLEECGDNVDISVPEDRTELLTDTINHLKIIQRSNEIDEKVKNNCSNCMMEFLKELPLPQLRDAVVELLKDATSFDKMAHVCYTGWIIAESHDK